MPSLQRLIKLVLAGDLEARTRLTRESERRAPELGRLTRALLSPPSRGGWLEIVRVLDSWEASDPPLEASIAYSNGLLDAWPDHLRAAPHHWLEALLDGTPEPRLALARSLHIFARSRLDRHGIRALSRDAHLANLTHLTLQAIELDGRSLGRLAASGTFQNLRVLDLSCNPIGDEGAAAIAASPYLQSVELLRLHTCGVTDAGARALARSPHLAALSNLDLSRNELSDAGFIALLEGPGLPGLEALSVVANSITDAAIEEVQTRDRLKRVNLYRNPIEEHPVIWRPSPDVQDRL